ncbi:DMT family transporter [Xylella fastidiosa subsp. multiplex]|uniref:DMT family transporter n=1 Tax=Xylella fastidiosa subsp. multiplex TaxID=644357 RepID=A0AAW6HTD3_XYLFS|nr:DMT family transporter [Xylella fastidiosa]MCH7233356.1 DMT family transporter [Xylella fastidiosa subsp. multiplex]MDC6407960.1 DMT family transporter [Xylella fastidiosa subsp. multiplex]MDD0935466.1 DMT family transporter [Xylella fastidiosa subsp. multiplex]
MISSKVRTAQLQIHVCVLLWGFTAIFGRLITLEALPLVWWRMTMVVVSLVLLPRVWRGLRALHPRVMLAYAGIGALVALHWLAFYSAVKLANASVAATCIALAPVFTAVVEPCVVGRPFRARELLLGLMVLPGVALVVGGVPDGMRIGIFIGVVSALLAALFGSLNKRMVVHADPLTVTALELGSGILTLTGLMLLLSLVFPTLHEMPWQIPSAHDIFLLLILSFACTLLPFALSLVALRYLSAYSLQLVTNLEPVYSIALAIVLLGEQRELTGLFYLGVAVVLGVVLLHPMLERRGRASSLQRSSSIAQLINSKEGMQ